MVKYSLPFDPLAPSTMFGKGVYISTKVLYKYGKTAAKHSRENSLFDTGKMSRSFLGPEIFFVTYLTLT